MVSLFRYFNAYEENGNLFASTTRGYAPVKIYGEPGSSKTSYRQLLDPIFADALIRIEAAGLPICLHVHDSVTLEVAENEGAGGT